MDVSYRQRPPFKIIFVDRDYFIDRGLLDGRLSMSINS